MYFFTHLYMAKVLYRHFSEKIKLDQRSFSYGNIKPDIPSRARKHHTLDHCLDIVCEESNQLMEKNLSTETFSVMLGEVCHYVCDFCCYHHLNEKLHDRKLRHFLYELNLHRKLFLEGYKLNPGRKLPIKDITSIVLETREAYLAAPKRMQRDLDFAFASAVWVCESIIYSIKNAVEIEDEEDIELYAFLLEED